jgi:hypothetical protein
MVLGAKTVGFVFLERNKALSDTSTASFEGAKEMALMVNIGQLRPKKSPIPTNKQTSRLVISCFKSPYLVRKSLFIYIFNGKNSHNMRAFTMDLLYHISFKNSSLGQLWLKTWFL